MAGSLYTYKKADGVDAVFLDFWLYSANNSTDYNLYYRDTQHGAIQFTVRLIIARYAAKTMLVQAITKTGEKMDSAPPTMRDKAKTAFVLKAQREVAKMIEDAMVAKDIGYPELAALLGIDDDKIQKVVKRNFGGGIARMMFELGYEVSFTRIPITVSKLKEVVNGK